MTEFEALHVLADQPPNTRLATANWLLALNEAAAREQLERDIRNARRRARRRSAAAVRVEDEQP